MKINKDMYIDDILKLSYCSPESNNKIEIKNTIEHNKIIDKIRGAIKKLK